MNGICPEKRTLRKEATGQCAPDLKPKNSFPTKVQSNRTTGLGKKNVNERGYNAAKKDREEPVGTRVHRYHGTLPPSVLSATCPSSSSSPSSLSSSQSLPSSSLWWWHKKRDNDGADDLIVTQQWQLVQLKGAGKASVTKYFRLHPHNFQLLTQWFLDIMLGILYPISFNLKSLGFALVWTIFLTNDFLIFSVCQGSEQKTAGWWLKVISISTIARKLCAGGSAHFLKIQPSSKCIISNSGSRSMCLQIFKDFKSNVDFWKVMKIILQKEKKQFSVISAFLEHDRVTLENWFQNLASFDNRKRKWRNCC